MPILRAAALAAIMSLLLALALAAPATAGIKGACLIEGEVKTVDKDDPNVGVRLVGGRGKFGFADVDAICTADTNKDGVQEARTNVGIVAGGWFENIACGSAKALGTVSEIDGPPKWKILEGKKFALEILGSTGTFKWHDWDKPDTDVKLFEEPEPDGWKDNDGGEKNYSPAGIINLTHSTAKEEFPDLLAGECAKGLHATGSISFDFEE